MRRVISLFLPKWPTDRWRRQKGSAAPSPDTPLVLVGRNGQRRVVMAVDYAADKLGLRPGLPLAQAQARVPGLLAEDATPEADLIALERIGLWVVTRYCPIVALDPPDGLVLDITGASHLMGGEQALLNDLLDRVAASSITARAACAETIGAAHALARFSGRMSMIVPAGMVARAAGALPIAALRLDAEITDRLTRLGFESIADLDAQPRSPLALRFGPTLGRRLDQLFGRLAEPILPLEAPELIAIRRPFAEPIAAPETIHRYIGKLVEALCVQLEGQGLGVRRLDLLFTRVDNIIQAIRVGTATPVRDIKRLTRLLTDKVETIDPGFGIEVMELRAPITEPLTGKQMMTLGQAPGPDTASLIDTLGNRFGHERLYRAGVAESKMPERAVVRVPPLAPATGKTWPPHWPRPPRLLSPPQLIETMALLPDHPPVQFTFRRIRRRVVRADGPERLAGEWWKSDSETGTVRDYFMVEDEAGERWWLFRAGDGENVSTGDQRWYLHGIFA